MAIDRPLVAIYPGSFDPPTNGHLDIIRRGAMLADKLIVAVLNNTSKQPLFSLEMRTEMLRACVAGMDNVEVDSFGGLLVDYAEQRGAQLILRGIRTVSDYESETQIAQLNRRLRPGTETIFLTAAEQYSFISSRMVKEVIQLGGDVSQFVPTEVALHLRARQ
jgi:pantetheine-phosphate adenylyltransferase